MTPEPCRGRANEPAFLVEIARKVAEIKGVPVAEVATVTTANAERLFILRIESQTNNICFKPHSRVVVNVYCLGTVPWLSFLEITYRSTQ